MAGFGASAPPRRARAPRSPPPCRYAARRLPPDPGRLLDPPQRPAQPPQRQYLLLASLRSRRWPSRRRDHASRRRRQRLGRYRSAGRFSGVHHWPVLGVHRGQIVDDERGAIRIVARRLPQREARRTGRAAGQRAEQPLGGIRRADADPATQQMQQSVRRAPLARHGRPEVEFIVNEPLLGRGGALATRGASIVNAREPHRLTAIPLPTTRRSPRHTTFLQPPGRFATGPVPASWNPTEIPIASRRR